MTTIGPFPLNKGWMSDANYFDCPEGGAFTFYGFQAWGNASIKTIDGYAAFAPPVLPSGTAPLGATVWQDPAQIGSKSPIMVVPSNAQIYTIPTNNFSSWSNRTGGSTVQVTGIYTFDVLNGILLMFNSGNTNGGLPLQITTYNGNASNLSAPLGNIVKVVNNFAFVSQVLASPSTQSRVYWSAVADPTTWPAGNFLDFRSGDGDYVTALSSIGTNLFIFKAHSIGILNTSTNIISGAVTLGPLTTFSDRIGCVSQTAVDTMPDGTIVFLGIDGNIYQTDGTTITNLSGMPSPNSNINLAISFPLGGSPPGIFSPGGVPFASLKVDPMFHRIVVQMTSLTGTLNPIYVFDYFRRTWSDWSELSNDTGSNGFGFVSCLSTMPNTDTNGDSVWLGYSNGYLLTFDPNIAIQHGSNTDWTMTLETAINLGGTSPPDFIPKCILIPITYIGPGGIIAVYVGFDGSYPSTPNYSSATLLSDPSLVIVPVKEFSPQTVSLHPRTMTIKLQVIGNVGTGQMIITPIYISNEVLG